MKTAITTKELNSMSTTKIMAITERVGLSTVANFKIMKTQNWDGNEYFTVVTRQGITNFMGDAQRAAIYGKKGIDYVNMNTANEVVKYLNS